MQRGAIPGSVLALAEDPSRPGVWMALVQDGSVWLSVDAGVAWVQVRDGDAMLRDVRDRIQMEADELAARQRELVEQAIDEAGDDPEAQQEAVEEVLARLAEDQEQAVNFSGLASVGDEAVVEPVGLWFVGDAVVVSLPDGGVWRSEDAGGSWVRLQLPAVHDIERLVDGRWLVATERGIFATDDTVTEWRGPLAGTLSRPVWDLQAWGAGAAAATVDGLLLSGDGVEWHLAWSREPVFAVGGSPGQHRLWFGTAQRVWRMMDPSGVVEPSVGPAVGPVLDVEVLPSGAVVAATSSGVVRSVDGGITFVDMPGGLFGQQVRQVRWLDGALWAAARRGLLRWELIDSDGLGVVPQDAFPPLGFLSDASVQRFQAESAQVGNARARVWKALLPAIHLQGVWFRDDFRFSRIDNGLDLQVDGYAYLGLKLEWSPRGASRAVDDVARVVDLASLSADTEYLALETAEAGTQSAMSRESFEERMRLTHQVTELAAFRRNLVVELGQMEQAPLARRLDVMLRIEETEAWLDLLTDGAVSAWRAGQQEEG